jgi:hypothetical protein
VLRACQGLHVHPGDVGCSFAKRRVMWPPGAAPGSMTKSVGETEA